MKTKALVLGAHPPFIGPWVSMEGADSWVVVVNGNEELVTVEASKEGGPCSEIRFRGESFAAASLQVHLNDTDDEDTVSVFVESVEE